MNCQVEETHQHQQHHPKLKLRTNCKTGNWGHFFIAASSLLKWIIYFSFHNIGTFALGDKNLCAIPLGLENGQIPNERLTSSSYYVSSVGPHQARLNDESGGGAWCPREPIGPGVREWIQVTLPQVHLISGVQLQGRFAKGRGQEYAEHVEIEYSRHGHGHGLSATDTTTEEEEADEWRKYYRFDGKSVLPANSDTTTINTIHLRPPLLANKIRILPYSAHRRTVCLRLELLGCPYTDGIISYRMRQGDLFSEGIPLLDTSYDGQGSQQDRKVSWRTSESVNDVLVLANQDDGNDSPPPFGGQSEMGGESDESESGGNLTNSIIAISSDNEVRAHANAAVPPTTASTLPPVLLSGGLGQLTDKLEGLTSFSMELGHGLGNGWVGWRKRSKDEEYIELLLQFDQVRQFYGLDIFTNNHPSKGVEVFAKVNLYFSIGGVYFSRRNGVQFHPSSLDHVLGREEARNVSIQFGEESANVTVGKWVKLHLFFRSPWIVVGELYFHSAPLEGNFTDELSGGRGGEVDMQMDFPDTQSSQEIRDMDSPLIETVIGIVCGLALLGFLVAGAVLWSRHTNKTLLASHPGCPSLTFLQHFHPSSSRHSHSRPRRGSGGSRRFFLFWRSTPTHIVNNQATSGELTGSGGPNVKDLLLTLSNMNGGAASSCTAIGEDHPLYPPPKYSDIKQGPPLHLHGNNPFLTTTATAATALAFPGTNVESYGSTGLTTSESALLQQQLSPKSRGGAAHHSKSHRSRPHFVCESSGTERVMTLRTNQLAINNFELRNCSGGGGDGGLDPETGYSTGTTSNSTSIGATAPEPPLCAPPPPATTTSKTHRKRKMSTSCWNIVREPGSSRAYPYQSSSSGGGGPPPVLELPLDQLRLIESLGSCTFGQVHLYECDGDVVVECEEDESSSSSAPCRLISKTINSLSEIRFLNTLDHENVLGLIGVCTELKKPLLALCFAPECGDLCSFLSRLTTTPSLSWLLNAGCQIASGMNYLESLSMYHRDLSARNCLVGREGSIRISDLAMACEQYRDDYSVDPISGQLLPLRWWPWETIIMNEFSMKSSIWSFAITLWEVLTLCRQKPLAHIADNQLPLYAEKYNNSLRSTPGGEQLWLPQPALCPPEIFELMRNCWLRDPAERPTFHSIHLFLQQKCKAFIVVHHV